MSLRSPLPVRNGVNATRLHLPLDGPWSTIQDYVLARFGHVDADGLKRRFATGEVQGIGGEVIDAATPLGAHEFLWYYRDPPREEPIPFHEQILHLDRDLLVVDKPHFLPTTPGGRYVQETALVRLRNRLGLPDLVPMHRLDRATAGVIMFAVRPETRGAYQTLFENRSISKVYEAVSALPDDCDPERPTLSGVRLPLTYRNHIDKQKGVIRVVVDDEAPPNAETAIEVIATGVSHGTHAGRPVLHTRLRPHTGRTHQLRVHLSKLGAGILNDAFYPDLLDPAEDDHTKPLQLLARQISFRDPLTGAQRRFVSRRTLLEAPIQGPAGGGK
jgi:tRNA pseudouridine32 synthase/23S rRNA pseudouridine746 synthase